jgi:hypothetical protein
VTLTRAPNPVAPVDGLDVADVTVPPETTIDAFLRAQAPRIAAGPCIVQLDDRTIPRDVWHQVTVPDGARMTIAAAAAGGDDSDTTRVVLTIVVAVAAAYTGGAVAAAYGKVAGAVASAVVQVAGSRLIQSVVPQREPDISKDGGPDTSPTYSIERARNRARLYEPLPVLIGEHRMRPDSGAKPYTEYDGGEQYLYQVFNFGLSNMEVDDIRIGETALSSFDDVDFEISGPSGVLRLWPGNVETTSGADLDPSAGWVQRTTEPNTTQIGVDVVGQLYKAAKGGTESLSVEIKGEYRVAGSSDPWESFLTADMTNSRTHYWSKGYWTSGLEAPGVEGAWAQEDFDWTRDDTAHNDGEYVYKKSVCVGGRGNRECSYYDVIWRWRSYTDRVDEAPQRDADDEWNRSPGKYLDPAPSQNYLVGENGLVLSNNTTEPLRRTWKWRVPEGQYEIRMRRVTGAYSDEKKIANVTWGNLKSYQPDDGDFYGQKRLALKIRASSQLEGVINRLSARCRGRVPVRNSNGDIEARFTRNPAWGFLQVASGRYTDKDQLLYGSGLSLDRIDLKLIEEWATYCDNNGLTFDGVFDRQQPVNEMLKVIAQAGRARLSWATGKLGVVIDRPGDPVQVFGMSNIKAGTFSVSYVTEKLPSQIRARYIDPRIGWRPNTLTVDVPFSNSAIEPADMEFKGVVDEGQVAAEANLRAADQYYHRRRVSWETDMEGLSSDVGQVVLLAHDLTQWDQSGRIFDGSTTEITLTREVTFSDTSNHWLIAVAPDGTMTTHEVNNPGDGTVTDTITLLDALSAEPDIDWRFLFGDVQEPGQRLKIIEKRPTRYDRVELTAVDEVQAYYDAADGNWAPAPLPDPPPAGTVSNVELSEIVLDDKGRVDLFVTWTVDRAPLSALRFRVNERAWETQPPTDSGRGIIRAKRDDVVTVQIRPLETEAQAQLLDIELTGGVEQSYTVQAVEDPPGDVPDLTVQQNRELVTFQWTAVNEPDVSGYEIRFGNPSTFSFSSANVVTRETRGTLVTNASIPPGLWTVGIKAIDSAGKFSINATTAQIEVVNEFDVIETRVAHPAWLGTIDSIANGDLETESGETIKTDAADPIEVEIPTAVRHDVSGRLVPNSRSRAIDSGWATFDKFVSDPVDELRYTAREIDIDFNEQARAWGDTDAGLGPGETGEAAPEFLIDHRKQGQAYDGFEPWAIGTVKARFYRGQVRLPTADGVGYLNEFRVTADVLERSENFTNVQIAADGTTLTYEKPFHKLPRVKITPGEDVLFAIRRNKTTTSVDIELYDASSNQQAGEVDVEVTGV